MKYTFRHEGGTLILYSTDRSRIYGEVLGADWQLEETPNGVVNHVLGGLAGEGTVDELQRANASGIDRFAFDFEFGDLCYKGIATLLRPESAEPPAGGLIKVETTDEPELAA